jgi:hypothetical protein
MSLISKLNENQLIGIDVPKTLSNRGITGSSIGMKTTSIVFITLC